MVTSARLGAVINQLQIGRQARVKLASYADRMILQITLLTKYDASMRNGLTIAWLHQVRENLADAVSVDHGLWKISGETHICIVLRPLPGSSGSFVSKDDEFPLAGADVHDMSDGRGTTVSTLGDGLTEAVTLTSTDAFDVKAADAVDEQITQSVSDGVCSSYPMHEAEHVQKDSKFEEGRDVPDHKRAKLRDDPRIDASPRLLLLPSRLVRRPPWELFRLP